MVVLCEICRTFDLRRIEANRHGRLEYRVDYAVKSSKDGCEFCRFLLDTAAEHLQGPIAYELIRLSPEKAHMRVSMQVTKAPASFDAKAYVAKQPFYNKLIMSLLKPKPLFGGKEERLELELCVSAKPGKAVSKARHGTFCFWIAQFG